MATYRIDLNETIDKYIRHYQSRYKEIFGNYIKQHKVIEVLVVYGIDKAFKILDEYEENIKKQTAEIDGKINAINLVLEDLKNQD